MTIRLSANIGFLWAELPYLERIERAAAAGFKAVEMHWPYDVPAAELAAACKRHGLTVVGINTPRGDAAKGENGLAALPGREEDFWQAFKLSLDYARALGNCAIHVMGGLVPRAGFTDARAVCRKNLARAAAEAAKYGITLLIEPLNEHDAPNYHLSTVEDGASLVAEVGAPNLKIMFDCYHVARQSGDVVRRLRRFYPLVGHIQFAGVPARKEPDVSEIDYRFVFAAISELGWPGFVGAEYKPRAGVEEGLGWIEALGLKLAAS
jgi:hydroxypyruvate isomerase